MLITLLWLALGDPLYRFDTLDEGSVVIRPLLGITSPTGLLWHEGELYLTTDLLEPRPGIYRLIRTDKGPWRAGLVLDLPQQELQGLTVDARGQVYAASSRLFRFTEEDWKNQVVILSLARRRVTDRQILPMGNLCGNGKPECGVVGVLPTENPDRLIAVTRKGLARLYLLDRASSRSPWKVAKDPILWGERTMPTVTEVQADRSFLYFLLQERREIARAPRAELERDRLDRLELETVFGFARVSGLLTPDNNRLAHSGCAEAFVADDRGTLYVLLNNRGFEWREAADGIRAPYPKLLVFRSREPSTPAKP